MSGSSLEGGYKVRLAVCSAAAYLNANPIRGMRLLNRVVELWHDIATVDATPNIEGLP